MGAPCDLAEARDQEAQTAISSQPTLDRSFGKQTLPLGRPCTALCSPDVSGPSPPRPPAAQPSRSTVRSSEGTCRARTQPQDVSVSLLFLDTRGASKLSWESLFHIHQHPLPLHPHGPGCSPKCPGPLSRGWGLFSLPLSSGPSPQNPPGSEGRSQTISAALTGE